MSFTSALSSIHKRLIDTFEKAADAAVKGEADAEQTFQDFEKACKETGSKSVEAAREEVKKHLTKFWTDGGMSKLDAEAMFGAKWKSVKDLGDKVAKYAPQAGAAAKTGWLKFVGGVTAIFAAALAFVYTLTPSGPTADQKAALAMIQRAEIEQQQVENLSRIALSNADFNLMLGKLDVPAAPIPRVMDPVVLAALPAPIVVAAAVPVAVQVTTPSGTRSFETTIAQVYVNSPAPVQEYLVNNPPAVVEEDPDNAPVPDPEPEPDPEPPQEHHKTFTVDGTPFGSATFSY